ncbi:hypothetical protein N0V86_003949 [Didymella sp. IMI 355093]|nr:hypothetical protein N0V86_003949 [Didymella sp. IMI 355093]
MASQARHVLITGGSRGIGLAIAQAFAKESYRCTLISRSKENLESAVSSLTPAQSAAPHQYISGSITSPDFWTTTNFKDNGLAKGEDSSKIDVLVNCAGITQSRLFTTTPAEDILEIVDTNLTSLMLGTRFLLRNKYLNSTTKSRAEAGSQYTPSIINVSSLLGVSGGHGAVAYAASKAGVLAFTRALAAEYVQHGVRVNAIVPGYVESDMTKDLNTSQLQDRIPLKRFGQPEEIAHAALFLAKNKYAHNCVLNLDGGLSAV